MKLIRCANCGNELGAQGDVSTFSDERAMFYNIDTEPICLWCWGKLFELPGYKRVALSAVGEGELAVEVSTVWLGNDHNFIGHGPPLIFETMIFANRPDSSEEAYCERYASHDAALAGHERAVSWARDNLFLTDSDQLQPEEPDA